MLPLYLGQYFEPFGGDAVKCNRCNVNKKLASYAFCSIFCASASLVFAESESCLDWEVQTFPASSADSSCSYFNHDKVSTRFTVHNVCNTKVSGVFSYYKEDMNNKSVMSVQSFAVNPGASQEIANPCGVQSSAAYQVSQVTSFDGDLSVK